MPWSAAKSVRWLVLLTLALAPLSSQAIDRSQAKVLDAFRDVVSQPAKSTVQIYCDGYRSALGAIVRSDGYVATKASELKGKVEIQLNDASRRGKFEAAIVATDNATDLAVLKIDAKDLPVVAWSDSPTPPVGSWLATPGLESKPIAVGVLSVGPRKLGSQAFLGIGLEDSEHVAKITDVHPETPAEQAGLRTGDIVLRVNGKEVTGRQQLQAAIRTYQIGEKIELVVQRDGKDLTVTATLASRSQLGSDERAEFQNSLGGRLSERRDGFPLVIQHDSVLQPAECGGPIVDLDGKVVGLNIARGGRVESFALPTAVVLETIGRLLKTQRSSTPEEDKFVGKSAPPDKDKQ